VGLAELNYSAAMHSATKQSPFKVAYGVDLLQHTDLALEMAYSTLEFNQVGEDLAKKLEQVLENTKLLLEKTQKCYEKQMIAEKHKMESEVAQKVLLNVKKFMLPEGVVHLSKRDARNTMGTKGTP
jgi:hypothetical protein